MRHFATESGKSKGQFYTPAEVSRVIAWVIGIAPENTKASTTAYDPTCGCVEHRRCDRYGYSASESFPGADRGD